MGERGIWRAVLTLCFSTSRSISRDDVSHTVTASPYAVVSAGSTASVSTGGTSPLKCRDRNVEIKLRQGPGRNEVGMRKDSS